MLVDNITQPCVDDVYKLRGENMDWKEAQELSVTLEYCEGVSNKKKSDKAIQKST